MGSLPFKISRDDVWKVVRGTLITAAGAGLAYVSSWLTATDFGMWGPTVIVPVVGGLIEMARRWLSDTTAK